MDPQQLIYLYDLPTHNLPQQICNILPQPIATNQQHFNTQHAATQQQHPTATCLNNSATSNHSLPQQISNSVRLARDPTHSNTRVTPTQPTPLQFHFQFNSNTTQTTSPTSCLCLVWLFVQQQFGK